ncbi:hypothetical protein DVU_0709 [Nitratidesulfovibrio vulgaris str. Hildenborough]|uniref:Uncharacterized protein n=1 Tax=Nitratidesulfovibrio vulgaris (strain ATCC 29579 / DSM 644 / CCUG 34227 / NCIMB 8303 / VKM B-1760 / Hildenborough) TaxID=882 RepID=Q72E70_NITV2|nr:hypothetical protein DVU_0709 [Nitratidesulfovibrio vulgaris str. Hildenborough]
MVKRYAMVVVGSSERRNTISNVGHTTEPQLLGESFMLRKNPIVSASELKALLDGDEDVFRGIVPGGVPQYWKPCWKQRLAQPGVSA